VFEKNLLAGKRILVTGGATGLGKSMGKRFLELGASLYICGRREEVLTEAADELRKATGGTV
jgi:short-subunit dehydrogenase involved in D-alanine esterification of teichoic acids